MRTTPWAVAALALLLTVGASGQGSTSIRITSPLGRTGVPGVVRVVAQVVTPAPEGVVRVRFFVDDTLLGEDTDGPPSYVTEWVDENPYEPRVIRAEVDDGHGGVVTDRVSLDALEVIEEASVASVLVEATVLDEQGRYVQNLTADHFSLFEDEEPQKLDLVQLQRLPTTFTLLVDGSQSMSRRIDLVRATAQRPASGLREGDWWSSLPSGAASTWRRGRPTTPTPSPTPSAASLPGAAPPSWTPWHSCRSTRPRRRPPGRHPRHRRLRRAQPVVAGGCLPRAPAAAGHRLRGRHRGIAGISLKGEALLKRIAVQMGGRPTSVARGAAAGRARPHCERRLQPLPAHAHADQPGDGRQLPDHPPGRARPGLHGEGPAGILRTGSAAHPSDPRVQRGRRQRGHPRAFRR
ncbi:MAG: hypothetical protein R2712_24290 [Vicinamibacterales bacterium]